MEINKKRRAIVTREHEATRGNEATREHDELHQHKVICDTAGSAADPRIPMTLFVDIAVQQNDGTQANGATPQYKITDEPTGTAVESRIPMALFTKIVVQQSDHKRTAFLQRLALPVVSGVLVAMIGIALWNNNTEYPRLPSPASASTSHSFFSTSESVVPTPTQKLAVYVVGAVRRPGVYHLKADALGADALAAAGGPTQDANLNVINLASPVEDNTRLIIPTYRVDSEDNSGAINVKSPVVTSLQNEEYKQRFAVYVTGAVRHPGVYYLRRGLRIISVLHAAGGVTPDANKSAINQAALIHDNSQLHVPTREEQPEGGALDQDISSASTDLSDDINPLHGGKSHPVVDIEGAVQHPGLYFVPSDALQIDALKVAGGPTSNADLYAINLAQRVQDGTQIFIPIRASVTPTRK